MQKLKSISLLNLTSSSFLSYEIEGRSIYRRADQKKSKALKHGVIRRLCFVIFIMLQDYATDITLRTIKVCLIGLFFALMIMFESEILFWFQEFYPP